jgi:cytochrome c oxidase subunit 2
MMGPAPGRRRTVNDTARWLTIGYSVLVAVSVAGAVVLWRSTRRPEPDVDRERAERAEIGWFVFVVIGLIVILFSTLNDLPWQAEAAPNRQVVHVTAFQFAWQLEPPGPYQAGRQLEFQLSSKDVNHGFAVFDPGDTFVTQAQVMPSNITKLRFTPHRAGRYTIRCFEYCGVLHDSMVGHFEVSG